MKRYLILLAAVLGILFFISGRDNLVFADRTDYYGCSYDGCTGYTHWWCDDTGWCSVGDCWNCSSTYYSCGGCSVSCGGGTQYCSNYDSHCGGDCGGGVWQSCNTQACCTGVYGSCTAWSACSVSCGGGTQTRTCYDTGCGTAQGQSQACNTQACCTGVYGSCTAWSACSVSCGGGTQTRTCYDTGCGTAQGESQSCNTQVCIPNAPTANVASAITSTGFTANWSVSSGATGYYLDVASDSGFTSFVTGYNNLNAGNVTSYSVTGLTTGITYYYRVRAYNASGTSGNSNTISQITIAGIPNILPPTNVAATSFTANWGAVTGAASYSLDVVTDTGFTSFVTGYNNLNVGNVTSYSVTGLSANTTYYYRVRSVNAAGTGSNPSNYIAVTTPFSGTACPVSAGGDITISSSCTFPGLVNGADNGRIVLQTGATLTINAGQTISWNPGQSIVIPPGTSIVINTTGALKQSYLWMPVVNASTSVYPSSSTQAISLSAPGANYKRRYQLNDVYTIVPN